MADALPRGATASLSVEHSARILLTSSVEPGLTSHRGWRPSIDAAESVAGSETTCGRPTISARASSTAGADTVTLRPRCPRAGAAPRA